MGYDRLLLCYVIFADCRQLALMLSVILLSVILLSVIMLNVILLSVILLNVVMLSVVAPFQFHNLRRIFEEPKFLVKMQTLTQHSMVKSKHQGPML